MNFLFQMDDPKNFDIYADSTYLLIKECLNRKINCFYSNPNNLSANIDKESNISSKVSKIFLNKDNSLNYQKPLIKNLENFKVIFVRQDPPYNMGYVSNTYLLSKLPPSTLIINSPESLRNYPEKHIMMNFPQLTPPTLISIDLDLIAHFIVKHKTVVLKPAYGNGGVGIKKITHNQINLKGFLKRYIKEFDSNPIIIQKFLSNYNKGDKRIILLGGKPLGAVLRIPKKDSIKSNFHAGGSPIVTTISKKDQFICNSIKDFLIKKKIYFAGIDIIDGFLTEINITSPTGLHEINKLNNVKLEKKIIDFFLKKLI